MQLPISIRKINDLQEAGSLLFICRDAAILKDFGLDKPLIDHISKNLDGGDMAITFRYPHTIGARILRTGTSSLPEMEKLRNDGALFCKKLQEEQQRRFCVLDLTNTPEALMAFLDGVISASYRFDKYKSKKEKLSLIVDKINVVSPSIDQSQLDELSSVWAATWAARDLVNETPAELTAEKLSACALQVGAQTGFKTKIYSKEQIEAMNLGGLLAVNRGSMDPPTFTFMEWKPIHAHNSQPIVLVGKGVVYDTGGLNLKTMPGSLDDMKCDMAGAAAVIGTMAAVALNKLPVHVVGLIPATDNRPGFNAYAPGDVLTMHNGTTVEVMDTDAEGRLILADALSYANQLAPRLVIDLATLTGNAVMAIGPYGSVAMGTANEQIRTLLNLSADQSGERLAWFPFWDEYDESLKSDVADMKNIGGREAGAITAGKFLSRFTNYPWVHLDIAGTAFLNKPIGYRGTGGTGVGVRLLYTFLKNGLPNNQ
ncbi:MAG: leucyl aminopeptidase [Breznakibacter sp.]